MIRRFAHHLLITMALLLTALPARAEIAVQQVTSPGGINAWLVEEHGIPFTALEIRFRGGTALDAPGKRGAVNLMTALIEEGAAELNAQQFATSRDALAAQFRFSASVDSLGVSARMLSENRPQATELLRLALTSPRFDADAVERVRGQVLSGIRSAARDPGEIAAQRFDQLAFGEHPYASSGDGTLESVGALTRDDIVDAWQGALARDRLYVAAVGDITPDELGAMLDHLLGGLPATGAALPPRADVGLKAGVTVVDFPTPQSVVLFGAVGIGRDDPDYFAAYVLNEILGGGGFGSRLMTELREKRGLTYGVGTALVGYDQADLIMGRFASDNTRVKEAIGILQQEWSGAALDEATLQATKTYLTGAYPLRFDGNAPIAQILVGMQMIDLPPDYITTRNAKIEAVALADVQRVAARLLRPEGLQIVVVGQPEGVATTP